MSQNVLIYFFLYDVLNNFQIYSVYFTCGSTFTPRITLIAQQAHCVQSALIHVYRVFYMHFMSFCISFTGRHARVKSIKQVGT